MRGRNIRERYEQAKQLFGRDHGTGLGEMLRSLWAAQEEGMEDFQNGKHEPPAYFTDASDLLAAWTDGQAEGSMMSGVAGGIF